MRRKNLWTVTRGKFNSSGLSPSRVSKTTVSLVLTTHLLRRTVPVVSGQPGILMTVPTSLSVSPSDENRSGPSQGKLHFRTNYNETHRRKQEPSAFRQGKVVTPREHITTVGGFVTTYVRRGSHYSIRLTPTPTTSPTPPVSSSWVHGSTSTIVSSTLSGLWDVVPRVL